MIAPSHLTATTPQQRIDTQAQLDRTAIVLKAAQATRAAVAADIARDREFLDALRRGARRLPAPR